ncbi:YbaK/EbsC family protein [Priestia megaterium]|uniref:YbaK/EbsC family protein n=1 Tax=Priestia megaterium TaxID=1404 RepID=UPI00366E7F72
MNALKESAQRVQNMSLLKGYTNEVIELPDSTRTAVEAAQALQCEVGQIAKSIVFKLKESELPLLVVADGSNRINEKHVTMILGESLEKADADFVKDRIGFVIGGVSPVMDSQEFKILIDEDLLQFNAIWAAAGHPKAVFQLIPQELVEMSKGTVLSVTG